MNKEVIKFIESIGGYDISTKMKKNLYYIPCYEYEYIEKTVYPSTTISDVIHSIYEKGHENGFKDGMVKKADDFKKLLNI